MGFVEVVLTFTPEVEALEEVVEVDFDAVVVPLGSEKFTAFVDLVVGGFVVATSTSDVVRIIKHKYIKTLLILMIAELSINS